MHAAAERVAEQDGGKVNCAEKKLNHGQQAVKDQIKRLADDPKDAVKQPAERSLEEQEECRSWTSQQRILKNEGIGAAMI